MVGPGEGGAYGLRPKGKQNLAGPRNFALVDSRGQKGLRQEKETWENQIGDSKKSPEIMVAKNQRKKNGGTGCANIEIFHRQQFQGG